MLQELLKFCTEEPTTTWDGDTEMDSKRRFKFPFVCSEVLSLENRKLSDALLRNQELVTLLFGFYYRTTSDDLDSTRASNVAKIICSLLRCRNVRKRTTLQQQAVTIIFSGRLSSHNFIPFTLSPKTSLVVHAGRSYPSFNTQSKLHSVSFCTFLHQRRGRPPPPHSGWP